MNPMGQKARAIALLFAKDEMEAAERKVKEISETLKQKETEINNLKSEVNKLREQVVKASTRAPILIPEESVKNDTETEEVPVVTKQPPMVPPKRPYNKAK